MQWLSFFWFCWVRFSDQSSLLLCRTIYTFLQSYCLILCEFRTLKLYDLASSNKCSPLVLDIKLMCHNKCLNILYILSASWIQAWSCNTPNRDNGNGNMGTGERKCFELNDPDSEKMCALALKIIYRLGLVDRVFYCKYY